jgi:thioesterase domain-containing protein
LSVRLKDQPGGFDAPGPAGSTTAHVVYMLPGMGGTSPLLAQFARACGERIRFVMLDYPGWRETLPGQGAMHPLIDGFVRRIAHESPDGPIAFAGYSMGAAVAYAIARRLEAGGRSVRFLGMIDGEARPYGKQVFRQRRIGLARRTYWLASKLAGAARQGETLDIVAMVTVSALMRERHHGKLRLLARLPVPPGVRFVIAPFRRYLMEATQIRLAEPWAAAQADAPDGVLLAPTALFRSSAHAETAPQDLGWGPLCADLRVVHMQGTHEGMLEKAHDAFVRQLDEAARQEAERIAAPTARRGRYAIDAPSTGSATPET